MPGLNADYERYATETKRENCGSIASPLSRGDLFANGLRQFWQGEASAKEPAGSVPMMAERGLRSVRCPSDNIESHSLSLLARKCQLSSLDQLEFPTMPWDAHYAG